MKPSFQEEDVIFSRERKRKAGTERNFEPRDVDRKTGVGDMMERRKVKLLDFQETKWKLNKAYGLEAASKNLITMWMERGTAEERS